MSVMRATPHGRPFRVLYVTESVPNRDPERGDGSSLIPYEVVQAFPETVSVNLLTFAGPVAVPSPVRARCDRVETLPTRSGAAATAALLTGREAGEELRRTARARSTARAWSHEADVTLLHGPHVAFLAHDVVGAVVLQTVDPWSIRLAMEARIASGWRARYRSLRAARSLRRERRLPSATRLLTVGEADAQRWSAALGRPVRAIPNGATVVRRAVRTAADPVICFVGSLNYGPNVESARTLVREVLPRVRAEVPAVRVVVAGRQPGDEVLALSGDGVEVRGNVASVAEVFAAADVAVFVDRSGVGIRNSVTEALAAGLPVVATPVAAREQPGHPRLWVEADVAAVANRVVAVLTSPAGDDTQEVVSSGRTWSDAAADYLEELQLACG
ncbi:MAG: glycosyltransferase family 4 protein [Propionibacteriaceae bacterium]